RLCIELLHQISDVVPMAGQSRLQLVELVGEDRLDHACGNRLLACVIPDFPSERQMPLHLEGGPEFAGKQVARFLRKEDLRLDLPRGTDMEEPLEILALAAGQAIQSKNIRAVADFFHGGAA